MKRTLTALAIALFGASALAKESQGCKSNVAACYVGGCSGQLCSDAPGAISTCEWRDEYLCYSSATCERQKNGNCGWTQTEELEKCLEDPLQLPQPESVSAPCFVGGCSGQVCSEEAGIMSTCEWREEYMCYSSAVCERQNDSQCGWTSTPKFEECVANAQSGAVAADEDEPAPAPALRPCQVGGCSGQICSDLADIMSTCEWKEEYMCYSSAVCQRQNDGQCGWTSTPEFEDCLANAQSGAIAVDEDEPAPVSDCFVGGCSSQLCTDDPNVMSTCEWTDSYACYQTATCARQDNGQCGWTSTPELSDCLANPPSSNAV